METEDLVLYRKWYTDKSTIGELVYKGKLQCYVLEDTVRKVGVKVYGETAIPMGSYDMDVTYSPRFKKDLPILKRVRDFKGIRIHVGNVPADTHGCLLVGLGMDEDRITQSRLAFKYLMNLIKTEGIDRIQIIDTEAVD